MTCYAITNAAGELVSTGTVLADPLPDGLTAVPLTDEQAACLSAGGTWVNGEAVPAPPPPDGPPDPLAILAAIRDALAPLNGSSSTGTVRTALLNVRTAIPT